MQQFSLIFVCLSLCFALPAIAIAQHGHSSPHGETTLDVMTVTAEQLEEYVKNHPQRVTVLDREEIEERNFLDVGEAMNAMPGVDVRQSGSGLGARISIRGSAGSGGVLVLVNGRPLNTSQYGGVDLGSVPIEIVKSVTVFKPPVPVWLGPGATAGAVNIVTHNFQEPAFGEKKNKLRLKLSGGSYGRANANVSYVMPQQGGSIMLTAGAGHRDGKRPNSDKDTGNFSLHWDGKNGDQTQYDVNGRYYHSEHGSAGPTDNPTPDARQRYDRGSLDFQIKGFSDETGDFSVKAYTDAMWLEDDSQSGQTSTLDVLKLGAKGENTWSHDEGQWALRVGGIIERDTVDHTLAGGHHREKVSLHTQFDRDFGDMTASIGVRGDYANDFDLFPAFSSGLSYAMGKKSLIKANAGYSVKIPTFAQLYQPSHGSIDQVRGNPNLIEEDVWSYDIGIEHKFEKDIVLEAAVFRTDNSDLITYVRGDDLIYRPTNISRAHRQGLEVSLKYKWTDHLSTDFNYTLQETENEDTGKELTYAPQHKGKMTLKCTLAKRNTRLETSLRAKSRQYSDLENTADKALDAYMSAGLKVVQPFSFRSASAEVFVHIQNLFDTNYESHHGYPDDGFWFVGGLNMTF